MIMYDVLQHYYDSPESWSSLLMSPLAENGGTRALSQSVDKHNECSFEKT